MSKVAVNDKPISPAITLKKILHKLRTRVRALFEPEEVEVTFLEDGKTSSYTYRIIEQKRAA